MKTEKGVGMEIKNIFDTDLALESISEERAKKEGIFSEETETEAGILTRIMIKSEEAASRLKKPCGNYISLEYNGENSAEAINVLAEEIKKLISDIAPENVLVCGLGNRGITPDSLGSLVCEGIFSTRAFEMTPFIPDGMKVASFTPGVLGNTGIETSELISAAADITKPDVVIVCDSLCARDVHRIGNTFQVTDSGIEPGGGLGNKRKPIDSDSLGCRVISIGVPTVVYCRTICHNVLEELVRRSRDYGKNEVDEVMERLEDEFIRNLVVTPKDIDSSVKRAAGIISGAINKVCGTDKLSDVFENG